MKTTLMSIVRCLMLPPLAGAIGLGPTACSLRADPATVLFQDDFTGGIPGWTAVQPPGNYIEGPMLWEFDKTTDSFSEQSNIYTDNAAASSSRVAVMLINDTTVSGNFTYSARLTAGDDDAFGLIFGYQNETTFYRLEFARQSRAAGAWPFMGWNVDRMNDRQITDLYGASTSATNANYVSFVNTAGAPFDVTVTVANNKLTLKVVDDPDGAAIPYDLLTDQPLPSAATGRVGLFSWGMSGGNPRSFRIQNPALAPTALAGDPASTVLTNWSFLVTPNGAGDTNLTVGGTLWAQGMSINGDRGIMIENGDDYIGSDNNAAGTTNFAAASAVAGNLDWSNYVYYARFISSDNDGFGMLLRFQDDRDFYRIAFRNQNSTSGVRRGISIQQCLDLVFDEVFSSADFLPPIYTPMDVYASIRTNRLQVTVITDPLGAKPSMNFYGPFDLQAIGSGATVPSGKIGIFSWAQYQNAGGDATSDAGTEVDVVKVSQVKGEGLLVTSAFGIPTPPAGLNDLTLGSTVTAQVEGVVTSQPGVRHVATGWNGVGSVPASGNTNSVTFTLNTFSTILWNWRTEYQLSVSATPGGSVSPPGSAFLPEGTNVTITATPDAGYIFTGWSGDSSATVTTLDFAMTRPITVTAHFAADSDNDQLPDSWELTYFGNLDQTASGDPDQDGKDNLTEYQLGTDPAFAEPLVASLGLSSQWDNEQRDPGLPGRMVVTDFGSGFRGVWENSNQNRYANDSTFVGTNIISPDTFPANASFQGPVILVRTNIWNPSWGSNFTAQAEYSVGDDDGVCFYFRYIDESNWFRVTVDGQYQNAGSPLQGVSVQKRENGFYSEVIDDGSIWTDPVDTLGYKRVRVRVIADNDNFEVHVAGWDSVYQNPPGWNESFESVLLFNDPSLPTGRLGIGAWGMDGYGFDTATNGNPISSGMFVDNITVSVGGSTVFSEDWQSAPLATNLPAGWSNPYAGAGTGTIEGDWEVMADGVIGQLNNNYGTSPSGTLAAPTADVEGPILLGPTLTNGNYTLEMGFHPFDDDGIGFVYDYVDTNNYSRVLFDAQAPVAGNLPQGLSVSRESGGVWTDLVVGDTGFIYTPGRPFSVQFANNNGNYVLQAWNADTPNQVQRWQWSAPATEGANRFGLATWASTDAHFTYVRAYGLQARETQTIEISGVSVAGGNVVLDISNPSGARYTIQRATAVEGPYKDVATGQTGAQYSEALPGATAFYRLKIAP